MKPTRELRFEMKSGIPSILSYLSSMTSLTSKQKRSLKGQAHHLEPVGFVGKEGVTSGLIESIQKALFDHELIKIKFVAFKAEKKKLSLEIAEKTESAHVDTLGHISIFYKGSRGKIKLES